MSRPKLPPYPCSVEDCDRIAESRGMCVMHYQRWNRNGHPGRQRPKKPAWCCDCRDPRPGWWNVECARCRRPILAELDRILEIRRQEPLGVVRAAS